MKRSQKETKRPHLSDIRTTNRARILDRVLQHEAISRQELSHQLGLTTATISRITKELIAEGICCENQSYRSKNKLGRRPTSIRINPEGGFVIAICLTVFSRLITITDLSGKKHHQVKIPVKAVKSPESAVEFIANYVDKLTASDALSRDKILGAALAIAGSIDAKTGYLKQAPLLKWKSFPIGEQLTERLSCPVRVENIADTLCLNYLERTDVGNCPYTNIFLVHIAIGMGASLAIDRRIVRRRGNEGWIGKAPVSSLLDHSENPIRLDQVSSGNAILQRLANSHNRSKYTHSNIANNFQNAVNASNNKSGQENDIFF